jgi:hypothetical protein
MKCPTLRLALTAAAAVWLAHPVASAAPDFTGVWVLDPARSDLRSVYGQIRIVEQAASELRVAVMQFAGNAGTLTVYPWRYTFGQWTPRRGGQQSQEPRTRVEWEDESLVTAKAPGTTYSVLQRWTSDAGDLRVQAFAKAVSFDFDFRVRGLSPADRREVMTYRRLPPDRYACAECWFWVDGTGVTFIDGATPPPVPWALRLTEQATRLEVLCRSDRCRVTDIVNGRRQQPRILDRDQRMAVPLSANTVIEVPKRE